MGSSSAVPVLGSASQEAPSAVRGCGAGDFDHGRCGVDPGQFDRLGAPGCYPAEQVAGSAADVEDALRRGRAAKGAADR